MNSKNKTPRFIFRSLLFVLFSYPIIVQSIETQLIEYSLFVSNENTEFKYNAANIYKSKIQQLSINWYESFSPYFHAGLEFGNIEMTQLENPLPTAKFTSGQYAGLLLRFLPFKSSYASLAFNLNYRYNKTKGKDTNQETQLSWGQSLLSSELKFFVMNTFELFVVAEYQNLQGTQQDTGIITQITPFGASKEQGYRFGINFKTNHNGVLGVDWLTGFRNGGRIHFRHQF